MKFKRIKYFLSSALVLAIVGCGGGGTTSEIGNGVDSGGSDGGNSKLNTPIVIIGPSTVYISSELNGAVHADGSDCRLEGWGQRLYEYAVKPDNIYNFAHPGANSLSFRKTPDELRGECDMKGTDRDKRNCLYELYNFGPERDHYWNKAKEKMRNLGKGVLLIQFGANEKSANEAKFKENIRAYINEAKSLNFTPVLITEIEKRIKNTDGTLKKSRGNFPKWMKDIAQEEELDILDLNAKSYSEYRKLSEAGWNDTFANCFGKWNGIKENTHFEPKGAKLVASWIKDLACKKNESTLCKQLMGVPKKFTLKSNNFIPESGSPQLSWTGAPKGTKSFAVLIDDYDAKDSGNRNWVHWSVININKKTKSIAAKSTPSDSVVELNSNGAKAYGNPAFPKTHKYVTHLYAMDTEDMTTLKRVNGVRIYKANQTYDHKEFKKKFGNFILGESSISSK